MTTLTITPDTAKKRLKLAGTVASGEKVSVTVVGFGAVPTENLQLRAMAGHVAVGVFPLEDEDEWTVSGSGSDLTCTLNLSTEQAERLCKFGAKVCFVLEDTATPQLYGVSELTLVPWVKLAGVDVPVNLENYKVRISGLEETLNGHIENTENPHGVTKSQVGLGNVDNTSDMAKPVSTAQHDAIAALRTAMTEADDSLRSQINEKYAKPSGGIPKTDMSPAVQTSLDKADTVTLKVSKSAFDSLLGLNLADTATQKEVRVMVQTILGVLKNAAVCLALMFALPVFSIDTDTAWEDVSPTNKVKDVVEQFSPPADFSTNNTQLVDTIQAKSLQSESDPTVPAWAKNPTPPLSEESDPHFNSFTNSGGMMYGPLKFYQPNPGASTIYPVSIDTNGVSGWTYNPVPGVGGYWVNWTLNWTDLLTSESDPTVPSWAKASSKPSYNATEVGALPSSTTHLSGDVPTTRTVNGKPLSSDITLGATDVSAYPNASGELLSTKVSAIGSYLNAEDARFVVTNYDSDVHTPEAYVEVRLTDNGTNRWQNIWSEMRRWRQFVGSAFSWPTWQGFHTWMTNITTELSYKADRAWGAYDSETGGYSPEGYTQISSSNILIAAGMAYQRTITTGGAVWVLQCNSGTAHIGGDTNGFFRVIDGDGNVQFEIIKGNRAEMGADASGITVTQPGNVMTIPYSVEAAEHPTISCCNNLATANWKDETDADCLCTVSWSGTSGAWVATVTPKTSQPAMFVKASYLAGAETMIRNVAPVSMDSIFLNGVKYYLGTATISGHTVLTLSTTPPTP